MKKSILISCLIAAFMFWVGGCSTSETAGEEAVADETAPVADAGTDAVPEGGTDGMGSVDAPSDSGLGMPTDMSTTGTAAGAPSSYTVQSGDTLMKIAFEVYGDCFKWRRIFDANQDQVSDPNVIREGMTLKIDQTENAVAVTRNGEKFMIRNGDTLGTISSEVYGTPQKWKKLWENNPELIKDPNLIFAGFYLYYSMTPDDEREKQEFQSRGVASVTPPPQDPQPSMQQDPAAMNAPAPATEDPSAMAPPVQEAPPAEGQTQ